jgi:flagellar protein FliO/FliZ
MMGKAMVLIAGINIDVTPTPSSTPSEVPYKITGSNNILELIGLVFILILILVAAYFTSRYIGKLSIGQLKNSNFKVIDTYRINPNKFLQIVKVANKFIVIAVSKDSVNFITELDEAEILIKEFHAKENINFKQILEKLKNKTD